MTPTEQSAHDYAESKSSGFEGQARADKYITCYNAFLAGAGKWISVNDRLPEINEDGYSENVIAIVSDQPGLLVMCYCIVANEGAIWANCYGDIHGDGEWDDNYEVTYWMPLPNPPLKPV